MNNVLNKDGVRTRESAAVLPLTSASQHLSPSARLFQKLVLNSLSKMSRGSLRMILPDGKDVLLGFGKEIEAEIRVLNPDFFRKCVLSGDIGFGESYVDGDWETSDISKVIGWMILNLENNPAMSGSKAQAITVNWLRWAHQALHALRPNSRKGSQKNIQAHYDLSNEFFRLFLDPSMTYSSGIFEQQDDSLERAQWLKYDRLCRKLKLKEGDHILEIGCGWGGFALHAAKHYGSHVTGLTVSREQQAYAQKRVQEERLEHLIDIRFQDYRDVAGQYDKIVSIEMLEAVGHQYLNEFFAQCHALLKPQGVLGLQVITCADNRYDQLRKGVDWIQKHIFPGSLLPSIASINTAVNKTGDMVLHHLEDIAPHYAKTLKTWEKNLNTRREQVLGLGFDSAFLRKWNYYFGYCHAAFAMRNIAVLQMVYTRPNNGSL